MTISSGGGNINYNPQPSIFELTTTGRESVANQGALGLGNTVILPHTDDIPFTQMDNRSLWNYKSESDRPTLKPPGAFRTAPAEVTEKEANWAEIFEELVSQLPIDVQQGLLEGDEEEFKALKNVLEDASQMLQNQEKIVNRMEAPTIKEMTELNANFPSVIFANALVFGKDIINKGEETLELFTANDPDYLACADLLDNIKDLLDGSSKEIK